MTDIMKKFGQLRQALTMELSSYKYRKSELMEACDVSYPLPNCKKPELAAMVSSIIISELENKYKDIANRNLTAQELATYFILQLDVAMERLNLRALTISKKIQDIFNFEPTENNNMINNRLVRISQQNIENIWRTNTKPIQCLCPKAPFNLEQTQKVEVCYRCEQKYHSDCFWGPEKGEELFECPFCYLRFCAPQKEVKQIIFGGYLPILKKQKVQYKINFLLDPKIKLDKSLYLEARCVKFNRLNRYEISWPDNCSFSIGKYKIAQFKPLLTTSPLKRRADDAIKLDRSRLQAENEFIIEERYTSENNFKLNKKCYHLVAIMVISELSNEMVLSKFQKNELPISESKQFLTKYMFHEKGDILIQKISISLKCQYYAGKMKLPARSRHCNTHMQPFDLMNFINSSIMAKNSTKRWKCPICDKRAYDLVIDKYILSLMQENPTVNEIIFRENGQPEMIQGKEDQNSDMESENGPDRPNEYQRREKVKPNIIIDIDLEEQQQEAQAAFEPIEPSLVSNVNQINQKQAEKKEVNKQFVIESEQQNTEKRLKQVNKPTQRNERTRNNNKFNEEVDPLEIKKIRKLNDGSLEIADNFNATRKRKIETNAFNRVLVELSSDGQEDPQRGNKNPEVPALTQKQKQLLTAVKKSKLNQKTQNRAQKEKNEKTEKAKTTNPRGQSIGGKDKPRQEEKEKQRVSKQSQKQKNKQLVQSFEVISIDSDGDENSSESSVQVEADPVTKEKKDQMLSSRIEDIIKNVDKQSRPTITQEDKELFEKLYSKIMEITEDEK